MSAKRLGAEASPRGPVGRASRASRPRRSSARGRETRPSPATRGEGESKRSGTPTSTSSSADTPSAPRHARASRSSVPANPSTRPPFAANARRHAPRACLARRHAAVFVFSTAGETRCGARFSDAHASEASFVSPRGNVTTRRRAVPFAATAATRAMSASARTAARLRGGRMRAARRPVRGRRTDRPLSAERTFVRARRFSRRRVVLVFVKNRFPKGFPTFPPQHHLVAAIASRAARSTASLSSGLPSAAARNGAPSVLWAD